jgi:hypothetical protein
LALVTTQGTSHLDCLYTINDADWSLEKERYSVSAGGVMKFVVIVVVILVGVQIDAPQLARRLLFVFGNSPWILSSKTAIGTLLLTPIEV